MSDEVFNIINMAASIHGKRQTPLDDNEITQ